MATRITRDRVSTAHRHIQTLRPEDVPQLRLGLRSMIDNREVLDILLRYPKRSVWEPQGREFAVVAPWRHRDDIASLHRWSAVRAASALLEGAAERCRAAGDDLLLVMELEDARSGRFYERAGFDLLQEVITYEMVGPTTETVPASSLSFRRVQAEDPAKVQQLLDLDHAAFPWLWRNSAAEFNAYLRTAGVTAYIGYDGDVPIAYVGVTAYQGWGHLDRIAVTPRRQGRGLGLTALQFAISTLAANGARRFGLSTQDDNKRSQRMYERFGFRRSDVHDYRLYGAALTTHAREQMEMTASPGERTGETIGYEVEKEIITGE